MKKALCILAVIAGSLPGRATLAGLLDPTNPPGPTMHTLEDIYQKVAVNHTLSPDSATVDAGNYAATNLTQVDCDLTPRNVAYGVTLFGITGTLSTIPASVAQTGQSASRQTGDDGASGKGAAWPVPRFLLQTDLAMNCVVDRLTGLMWIRNPSDVPMPWSNAVEYCEVLNGLEGRGGFVDWRLPNRKELESLVHCQYAAPALPNTLGTGQHTEGDPFAGLQTEGVYWSSTAYAPTNDSAWALSLRDGSLADCALTNECFVWPVRAGNLAVGRDIRILDENKGPVPATSFAGQSAHRPIQPLSFRLLISNGADGYFSDDGTGGLGGAFNVGGGSMAPASGTINYSSGVYGIILGAAGAAAVGKPVTISYTTTETDDTGWTVYNENKGPVSATSFSGQSLFTPIQPGSVSLLLSGGVDGQFVDDGFGTMSGYFNVGGGVMIARTGTFSYQTGIYIIDLGPVGAIMIGRTVTITYTVQPR